MGKRISKPPEIRKAELLDSAFELFRENGYAETSISQITAHTGVAKGTFYYHFGSKREVLYWIFHSRFINVLIEKITPIAENPELTALQKMEKIARKELEISLESLPDIQKIKNADLFRRIFKQTVKYYVPILEKVARQGMVEGVFHMNYPRQSSAATHAIYFYLFHPGIFQWNPEEAEENGRAAVEIMERIYGAAPGTFRFYEEIQVALQKGLKME